MKVKRKTGKPKAKDPRLKTAFNVVATPEWREWFYELAELNRAPGTVTVEQALTELAKRLGLTAAKLEQLFTLDAEENAVLRAKVCRLAAEEVSRTVTPAEAS